tara:strand:+ start:2981 stop:4648 length:1668 start_codon:yes stop_codon:yes gene_type:complete
MNFIRIYIKSGLFLIQILLSVNLLYSQEYVLEFISNEEVSKKVKKFNNYSELILSIDDSLSSIKKQGYFGAKVDSFLKLDSLNYQVIISKNQKVKYVDILNKDELDENTLKILNNYSLENGLVKFEKIDSVAKEISEILSELGYPFSEISFKNLESINPLVVSLEIDINYGTKRNIDKVVVQGYENFPKNFINNIFKPGKNKSLDVDKALAQSNLIDKSRFARNKRNPEILFTKDSTALYLYIEKIRRNSFDGFISFNSDENSGKINVEGYAKISLNNTFNLGENINFDFKSQKNRDRALNSNIYLPYILGSALNLNYSLNLTQRDSTFTSNENIIDVDMNFRNLRAGLGFQINNSTVDTEAQNVEDFKSRSINIFSDYTLVDDEDLLIPDLFKISFRFGTGLKEQSLEKTNFNKFSIELYKKFNFSSKLKFQTKIFREEINSKNLVNNELLRFGGSNSIRGFDDNSIFTDGYTLLNSSLNFYINDTIYIYTIFDVANYSNDILNIEQDIYSGGFGFSSITKNGIVSISYSKGNNWGNRFNLKNAKINVIFAAFF